MTRLTLHVQRRIAERRLMLAWIEATLANPDWTLPDPDPMLVRAYKVIPDFGMRVLRVVYRLDGADILVVTAHFDRGARRP